MSSLSSAEAPACAGAAKQIAALADKISSQIDIGGLRARLAWLTSFRDEVRSKVVTIGDDSYNALPETIKSEANTYGLFDYIEYNHEPINCFDLLALTSGTLDDKKAKTYKAQAQRKGIYRASTDVINSSWTYNAYLNYVIPLPIHDSEINSISIKLTGLAKMLSDAIKDAGITVNCAQCSNILDVKNISGDSSANITQYISCLSDGAIAPSFDAPANDGQKNTSLMIVLPIIIFVILLVAVAVIVIVLIKRRNGIGPGPIPTTLAQKMY